MEYQIFTSLIKLPIYPAARQRTLQFHTFRTFLMLVWGILLLSALVTSAHAGEKEIRRSLQSNFPNLGKIEHIIVTPYAGLYEVLVDGQLVYTDAKGLYLFDGNVIETKTRRNISEERRRILFAIDFDKLPLELAVKKVKGNGKRKLAQFTDPNCSFCKRLEKELNKVTDVTIYSFLYPIFPGSDVMVRNVLCSKDPVKTWDNWMLNGITPEQAMCDTPQTEQVRALGQKLHVTGTPNIIFGNGVQSPGYLVAEELERNLNQSK
jgi:thiol:disulfide interchange protein DsbC